jgi:hypothetical protein
MARLLFILLVLLVTPLAVRAEGPILQPPCGGPSQPAAAAPDRPPAISVLNEQALRKVRWKPPACLNWTTDQTRLAVALAGEFRFDGTIDDLLARFSAFSAYKSIRYWSTSKQAWQALVSEAGPDLRASDLMPGSSFDYFENGRAGRTVYRLRILERTPARAVVASENVTPIRAALVTAFDPGALQSVTFLDKRGPGIWSYYQIIRAGQGASSLALGREASYVNRSAALYRYIAGIPTDREPPVAP